MTDRRFNDAEVAAIFERATEVPATGRLQPASSEGMTLSQLQDIGREVGIPPDRIARAARSLDRADPRPQRTVLGLPFGVGRTVDLDRGLSDEEWERLVVDLRETFDARGRIAQQGALRQWTNGNLQALLEPTETGFRVRLRTFKGDAPPRMFAGLAMLGSAAIAVSAAVLRGAAGDIGMLVAMGFFGMLGAAMLGTTVVGLPRWARLRRTQMEQIAERLESRTSPTPEESDE